MAERRAAVFVWRVVLGAAALALWQTLVSLKILDAFFVSRPSDIVQRVLRSTGSTSAPRFGALSYRTTELAVLSGSTTRAEQILGWRARMSLDEGLDRTVAWFRTVGTGLPEYQLADAVTDR